ncbi:MAG: MtnX-like HAD-IB family phosphatase [Candidatus Gastranaerophilales bacterium]|nr:MtnX-like HAD-IB family phosphatase [Candidatus Gastranaerophilales bacterium]
MREKILVSDFDGTITKKDTLSTFLEEYADSKWLDIENDWRDGKFGSQECLIRQFALVPKLNPKLIDKFLETVEIDEWFIPFCKRAREIDMPVVILSDGLDYFINKILEKNKIDFINVITNHAYFNEYEKFILEFPNDSKHCSNNAGTCKCKVVKSLKKLYKTVYYVGDGASDFCVSKEPDVVFAKAGLAEHCKKNNIKYIEYRNYKKLIEQLF